MNVDFNLILDNTKFDVVAHSLVGKNIKDALTSFFSPNGGIVWLAD